jgi:hypothetical protein
LRPGVAGREEGRVAPAARASAAPLELAAVFLLLLALVWRAGEWIAPSAAGALNALLGLAVAAVVVRAWRRDAMMPAALGLAPDRLGAGLASAAFATGAGALVIAALGAALGTAALDASRLEWLAGYVPGIVAQQLLLQGFFAPGIRGALDALPARRRDRAAIATATLAFVALHAPNPALMLGVAAAGAFWVGHFFAHRNLVAVIASHLLLGATAMAALGPGPMLNLRVGPGAWDLLTR